MSRCPLFCTFEGEPLACVRCGLPPRTPVTTPAAPERNATMPAKYKARTRSVDAGRYSFEITTGEDGSVSATLVYVNTEAGVRTVAVLAGMAEPGSDGSLVTVMDAYDAGNALRVRY